MPKTKPVQSETPTESTTEKKVYHGREAWQQFYKKLAEFGALNMPSQPFAQKPLKITLGDYRPPKDYRGLLTTEELKLIKEAIPELTNARLEMVLRQVFHMGDERIQRLTWPEIFAACRQKAETETGKEAGNSAKSIGSGDSKSGQKISKQNLAMAIILEYAEKGKSITQAELAKKVGVSPSTLHTPAWARVRRSFLPDETKGQKFSSKQGENNQDDDGWDR